MAISEVETSTALVLLKENDLPAASITGRKPVELEKAHHLFCSLFFSSELLLRWFAFVKKKMFKE